MVAIASFKDHVAGLLAEHERLQHRLEDLHRENARLQERLEVAGLVLEPEPLSPKRLEPAMPKASPASPAAGAGAQMLEPKRAAVAVPIAPIEAGAGDAQLPKKLKGHWDTPSAVKRISSRSLWGNPALLELDPLNWATPSDPCPKEPDSPDNAFTEQPPEVWPEYWKPLPAKVALSVPQAPQIQKGPSMICGEAVIDHKSRLQRLVIRPNSHRRALWDCISILMLGYDVFYLPLEAFTLSDIYVELGFAMDLVSICFWTVDILMTFLTGYHTQGIVEMRPKRIARRYVGSLFWLDFAVACIDWILLLRHQVTGVARMGKTTRAARLFRTMRTTRLLRGLNVAKRLKLMFSYIKSDLLWTLGSLSSMFLMLMIFNHYIASGWFAVGNTSGNGWIQAAGIEACEPLYCYMTSLHWSLTQHAPASMEVHAVNLQERIYSIFVLLFGMVCFSSIVSSITSAIMHLRKVKSERAQQEVILRQYFQESKISAELGQRIWLFLQNNHFQHRKRVHRKDLDILKLVPESLTNSLNEELYLPVLEWNPFFKRFSQVHAPVVNEVCHRCITERFLYRREELFAANKVAESVSFITNGSMSYRHRNAELCTLVKAGQWACEAVLWVAWRHCGCLAALTSCEIVQLHAGDFRAVSCRECVSHSYVSTYAKCFRDSLLSTEMWYTDIWSDMEDIDVFMVPARSSQYHCILDSIVRWVPVAFRPKVRGDCSIVSTD